MRLISMRLICIAAFLLFLQHSPLAQVPKKGDTLISWTPGYLDIHHINTGRGSAAYFIFPDGTTLLFDAGEEDPTDPRTVSSRNSAIRPDNSKKAYEWICNYIRQAAPKGRTPVINYAVLTHFHDDHFGAWYEGAPRSKKGDYALTGITGVAELITVEMLLDRGYPRYDIPYDMRSKEYEETMKKIPGAYKYWQTMDNYLRFVDARPKQKLINGNLQPGSRMQVAMKYDAVKYPGFYVQNVKSNNRLWNGKDTATINLFPHNATGELSKYPTENALSQGLLINYGKFRYYSGGDIPGVLNYGQEPWMDVETPLSKSVGKVDIATMDHHGNRDAVNENMVKNMRPRVWIGQSWSSDHPGHEVLIRMTTPYLYEGSRDLFATNMLQSNKDVIGNLIDNSYKSQQGHIVVRVLPGGNNYYIIILDDAVSELKVKDVFGPYESSSK